VGCLLALLALVTPRFVLVLLWISTNYLSRAFETWLWPTLGFLFLPTTTLAYAVAQNEFNGFRGIGLVILLVGFAIDVGLIGGGERGRRQRAS
jgi:hypothetical protein